MASVVLNAGQPSYDQLYASGASVGGGGIFSLGAIAATGGTSTGVWNMVSPLQCGIATIPAAAATIAVPVAGLTAGAIIMVTPTVADATCVNIHVPTPAAGTFSITGSANATAAVPVMWFVVHL